MKKSSDGMRRGRQFVNDHPRRRLAFLPLAASLLLSGCGGEGKPQADAAPNPADVSRVLSLDYKKDETGRTIEQLSVPRGMIVYLSITSDVPGALHLHGYEVTRPVTAGKKTALVVSADNPGQFSVSFDRGRKEQQIAFLNVAAE